MLGPMERADIAAEAIRLLGGVLEEARVLRMPGGGPDRVILQDGRSFALPAPEELPHHPELAARIVAAAPARPAADDVVGDLEPGQGPRTFPPGYSDRDMGDKPWWPYNAADRWFPFDGRTFEQCDGFEDPQDCRRRCNFLNMLASGEPIKAV